MDTLRLSASDWCYFRKGDEPRRYYGALAEAGYAAAEMVPPDRYEAAREAGLIILNVAAPGMQTGLNRVEHHAALLPQIEACIERAGANRIGHVIVFSGNRAGQDDREGLRNCLRGLSALAPCAEQAGVTLLFEMLNSRDHADYQADRAAFGFELVKALGSPHVRVLYDIYHMQRMGEAVAEDVLANLPAIAHLHVAGSPRRDFPGAEQAIDYAALVSRVQAAGYRGYWGMEFLPVGEPRDELRRAAARFQSYSRI